MFNYKIISLLPLLLISSTSLAEPKDKNSPRTKVIIKTAPLNYFNYFAAIRGFNLGIEISPLDKFSFYFEGSAPPNNSLKYFKSELKFYFIDDVDFRHYLSIEYMYKECFYNYSDSIKIPNTPKYYKTYSMSKYINAFNVKYGVHLYHGTRFCWDFFAGMGLRMKNSICNGLSAEEAEGRDIGSPERGLFLECGKRSLLNVTLGFRICFAIV